MNLVLAVFLKPFVAFVFFALAYVISRLLWRMIPDGKIKRALYSPLPWLNKSRRRPDA